MASQRKVIRHAVVALLIGAATAAAARVYPTRVEPIRKSKVPALGVYTLTDATLPELSTQTEEVHELDLEIVAWVDHLDDLPVDDAMDDITDQVEAAMLADPFLGGKAMSVDFKGTVLEVREDSGRSDPIIGIAVLAYSVRYRVSTVDDATAIDDFNTANITTTRPEPEGIADTVPAIDTITVQEP